VFECHSFISFDKRPESSPNEQFIHFHILQEAVYAVQSRMYEIFY